MQLYAYLNNSAPLPVGTAVCVTFAKDKLQKPICTLPVLHQHQLSRSEFQIGEQLAQNHFLMQLTPHAIHNPMMTLRQNSNINGHRMANAALHALPFNIQKMIKTGTSRFVTLIIVMVPMAAR